MIFTKIPIFITVRGHNAEEIIKNKECLKFSYVFIKEQNLFNQTFIISDNINIINYAKDLGFKHTIHYACRSERDIKYLEYLATYTYSIENNYHPDWIILLNVNQLFKNSSLLYDCIRNIDSKYDVIASYTEISNKNKFYINKENNKIINGQNKSSLLSNDIIREKMIDAAIYAVRTEFAFSCMEYEDPSIKFWSGKFKFFKNKTLYTDIYSIKDIQKFYNIRKVLDAVNEIIAI